MASKSAGRCYHRSSLPNRIPRRDSAESGGPFWPVSATHLQGRARNESAGCSALLDAYAALPLIICVCHRERRRLLARTRLLYALSALPATTCFLRPRMAAAVAATCASPAAKIFSVTMRLASASARAPPATRRSIRRATTPCASRPTCQAFKPNDSHGLNF